jgi:hypothetical protein
MTVSEMFEELARLGVIIPTQSLSSRFEMPTMFEAVPTILTYGTPEPSFGLGTEYARLEESSRTNRG